MNEFSLVRDDGVWELIPGSPFKYPAGLLLISTAPLLEKEGHTSFKTLVTDIYDPLSIDRPGFWTGLSADDDPMDAGKVEVGKRTKKGLQREKPGRCVGQSEMVYSAHYAQVFDTRTHPDVLRPRKLTAHLGNTLRTLRQDLKLVLGTLHHNVEHAVDEIIRHVRMKQVTHRVYEDFSRFLPREWDVKHMLVERNLEAIPVVGLSHSPQPLRHRFSVTMLAASAHLCTARERIPCGFSPLNS